MARERVLLTGAGGFVASHLIPELVGRGKKVRALVHSPRRAYILESQGCETVVGDIRDRAGLKDALADSQAVIHLVGILREKKGLTFKKVVTEGTGNIVAVAQDQGAKVIFNSALNSDPKAALPYLKTKGEAEELVRASGLPYTILRCSYIYGPGGGFVNLLANMVNFPVIPVFGSGEERSQPVYVKDVAYCLAAAVDNEASDGMTMDMVGPDVVSYNGLLEIVAKKRKRAPRLLHLPMNVSRALVRIGETGAVSRLGAPVVKRLFKDFIGVTGEELVTVPMVTSDELRLLQLDLRGDTDTVRSVFGRELTPLSKGLDETFADA